jgi:hypothetical protein
MPGLFTIVLGDDEAKSYLRHGDVLVERMMIDVTGDISSHAAAELKVNAPGRIKNLVGDDEPIVPEPGIVEAVAGIEPEVTEETFGRGIQSDPADFPVYVEKGTGVYGEYARPITVPPGIVMVFHWAGKKIFTRSVEGQRAQHYAEHSYEETLGWVPSRLQRARLPIRDT